MRRRALAEAGAAKGGTVYAPAGIYRIDGSLEVPTGGGFSQLLSWCCMDAVCAGVNGFTVP
ncbi:MAG: hypothetical protein E7049_09455 [Lentisphaerae bacterium]|nr:hypothetical protein [Lentisphaerota bacterium]